MLEQNPGMDNAAAAEQSPGHGGAALAVRENEPAATLVPFANSSLSPAQVLALRALAEGASLNDAAKAAGVERNALYRWRTRNPHFIAAMNAWRRDHLEIARQQFLLLRDSALDAVRKGLAEGDARIGIAVLDRMGASAAGETNPTLPAMVDSPEIEHPEAEMEWRSLEQSIGRLPIQLQRLIPHLLNFSEKIYNKWGMEILKELAEAFATRLLQEIDRWRGVGFDAVREAWLAVQRANVPAPVSGTVARRSVQVGQRVQAGVP